MPGRIYEATWGRLFALGYDRFLSATEKAGLRDMRRELLSEASGRTLEVGAGTGLNADLYPESVDRAGAERARPLHGVEAARKASGRPR